MVAAGAEQLHRKVPSSSRRGGFLILHPNYGFLVLEVKGGIVRYDSANRRWDRVNGTHQMKDPFEQARGNEHAIVAEIERRARQSQLPGVRGHAVVFPDCNWSGTAAPGADASIILDSSHLSSLAQKVESIFRHYDRRSNPRRLTTEELNMLLLGLTSTFKLTPVRWRQIEEQERQILRFTEEQARNLEFIEDRPQAIINGVAGSGKTQLALAKARRFAGEGKKVLLLCFNSMLAEAFKDQLQDEPTVTALNYHKLVRDWCVKAKVKFPASPSSAFWGEPAALL